MSIKSIKKREVFRGVIIGAITGTTTGSLTRWFKTEFEASSSDTFFVAIAIAIVVGGILYLIDYIKK